MQINSYLGKGVGQWNSCHFQGGGLWNSCQDQGMVRSIFYQVLGVVRLIFSQVQGAVRWIFYQVQGVVRWIFYQVQGVVQWSSFLRSSHLAPKVEGGMFSGILKFASGEDNTKITSPSPARTAPPSRSVLLEGVPKGHADTGWFSNLFKKALRQEEMPRVRQVSLSRVGFSLGYFSPIHKLPPRLNRAQKPIHDRNKTVVPQATKLTSNQEAGKIYSDKSQSQHRSRPRVLEAYFLECLTE
ncbi:unnamed protein product [Boreogadus saida]